MSATVTTLTDLAAEGQGAVPEEWRTGWVRASTWQDWQNLSKAAGAVEVSLADRFCQSPTCFGHVLPTDVNRFKKAGLVSRAARAMYFALLDEALSTPLVTPNGTVRPSRLDGPDPERFNMSLGCSPAQAFTDAMGDLEDLAA